MNNLGIYLNKGTIHQCTKNCKTLLREVKDYSSKWGDISCVWVVCLFIAKVSFLPKLIPGKI